MTIKRIFGVAAVLVFGWIAVMAMVMRFSDAAPAAVAILPSSDFLANLPDVAVIARGAGTITLRDDDPELAARLYAAGAWLVLPAGLTGCLPLPKSGAKSGVQRG